jgi:hypothetical protein
MDLVARRLRLALGRLARAGDPALAAAVRAGCPDGGTVRAGHRRHGVGRLPGTVAITGPRQATVPGFPESSLADAGGPWRQARAGAAELGAPVTEFWDRVGAHGLLVPADWLPGGGWPALWRNAAGRR